MSMMPFDVVGPIMQAPSQAANASNTDDVARNRQADRTSDQAKVREVTENSIGTSDSDTEVNPDAMGAGGQGRAFSENPEETEEQHADQPGITKDEDGQYHLDIEV